MKMMIIDDSGGGLTIFLQSEYFGIKLIFNSAACKIDYTYTFNFPSLSLENII